MARSLPVLALTLCGALVLGASAAWCVTSAGDELSRHVERTRIVYRFDTEAQGIDPARDVFRQRLKSMGASQVTVERSAENEVTVEFGALDAAPLDKHDERVRMLTERGDMSFYIAASDTEFIALGKDQDESERRVRKWLRNPENADIPLSVYNALDEAHGGPPAGIRWFTHRPEAEEGVVGRDKRRLSALSVPKTEWTFTSKSLARVTESRDNLGYPAVAFQMRPEAMTPFGNFTEANTKRPLAIVLNDEIVSFATINERLPGQAQIYGHFTDNQVHDMVRVLRSGELPSNPVIVSCEQIAPARDSRVLILFVVAAISACASGWLLVRVLRSAGRKSGAPESKSAATDKDWSSSSGPLQ